MPLLNSTAVPWMLGIQPHAAVGVLKDGAATSAGNAQGNDRKRLSRPGEPPNPAPAQRHKPPGLIQRYRQELQARQYSRHRVGTYEQWLRRFLRIHQLRHPHAMGNEGVTAFLAHLAVTEQLSGSTQNQSLVAMLFL